MPTDIPREEIELLIEMSNAFFVSKSDYLSNEIINEEDIIKKRRTIEI